MKRSRAPLQSLAELSYGAATDEDEEGESDDDDDDGQRRDRQLKKRKMKGGKGRGDDSAEVGRVSSFQFALSLHSPHSR